MAYQNLARRNATQGHLLLGLVISRVSQDNSKIEVSGTKLECMPYFVLCCVRLK